MQERHTRVAVLALLIACALTAAYFLWTVERRSQTRITTQADLSTRLARMSETIAGIGTAQQSYVAPGQLDEPWFERTSALVTDLSNDIEQARSSVHSPESAATLQAFAGAADEFMAADARARQNLKLGQELMAADVIFSDGRSSLDAMLSHLRELQSTEQAGHTAEVRALSRQRWIALGITALVWAGGLLALVKLPAASATVVSGPASSEGAGPPRAAAALSGVTLDKLRASVDLASAAALCTDLSRVTTPDALPALLGRAARVLDASGMILWMSAGEQLFPVMGHGYKPDMLTRLGPISRNAENAAADAWRTGRLTVVGASGATGKGAIVAPLFGLHTCIGVLTAEVRNGAEHNPAMQAVAAIIAAQLATVVPAWPATSLTPPAATADAAQDSQARSA